MPTQMLLRQVVWMMLVTEEPDASKPPTDIDRHLDVSLRMLSLDDFDVENLAMILHLKRHEKAYIKGDRTTARFSRLILGSEHRGSVSVCEGQKRERRKRSAASFSNLSLSRYTTPGCRSPRFIRL